MRHVLRQQDGRRAVSVSSGGSSHPAPKSNGLPERCKIRIARLPERITPADEQMVGEIRDHGLLFLEHPYVVPGGQFNEMYGWDSYFIIRGLLRDNRRDLASGMVENFFYEIEHYGGVLNANRTYYLGRSQPPFLTSMILALYESDVAAGKQNPRWLGEGLSISPFPITTVDARAASRRRHRPFPLLR